MSSTETDKIVYSGKKTFIFVEGQTDEYVVETLGVVDKNTASIIVYGGITQLRKRLQTFCEQDIPNFLAHKVINRIYILIDSDSDSNNSFQLVIEILEGLNRNHNNHYPIPSKQGEISFIDNLGLGILTIPSNEQGCLETMVLKAASDPDLLKITNHCQEAVVRHYNNPREYKCTFAQKEYLRYSLYMDAVKFKHKNDFNKAREQGFNYSSPSLGYLKDFLSK